MWLLVTANAGKNSLSSLTLSHDESVRDLRLDCGADRFERSAVDWLSSASGNKPLAGLCDAVVVSASAPFGALVARFCGLWSALFFSGEDNGLVVDAFGCLTFDLSVFFFGLVLLLFGCCCDWPSCCGNGADSPPAPLLLR